MDVSNSTGEDTQYRTGSGSTKMLNWAPWTHLPKKAVLHCPDPKLDAKTKAWGISFQPPHGKAISATFDQPMQSVTLVKTAKGYEITTVKKPAEKPKPISQIKPVPKPPAKATKATNATKATKAKKNAA